MRSRWLSLAFTRFRYLINFQETDKCNSCFVIISNNIQVILPIIIASTNKLYSLKLTKWHAHVAHKAKHVNMVESLGICMILHDCMICMFKICMIA